MEDWVIVALVLAGVVVIGMFLFRKRIGVSIENGDTKISFEGENESPSEKGKDGRESPPPSGKAGGNVSVASGPGAVSIGGSAKDVSISTGSAKDAER